MPFDLNAWVAALEDDQDALFETFLGDLLDIVDSSICLTGAQETVGVLILRPSPVVWASAKPVSVGRAG